MCILSSSALISSRAARSSLSIILLIISLLPTVNATTEEDSYNPSASSWSFGAAMFSEQKPYTDIDRDNFLLPLLVFENSYIRFLGNELAVKLPSFSLSHSNRVNFSLISRYNFLGYKESDADILAGMDRRKASIWAGPRAEWQTSIVTVNAELLSDLSSYSTANRFNLNVARTWFLGQHLTLTPRIGIQWVDRHYTDYYFGVRAHEVRPDRTLYQGRSDINAEAGITANYFFKTNHLIFMDIGVTRLGSETRNSPLVSSSTENQILAGYLYRFR